MEQETKTTPAVEVWRPIAGWEGLYEVSSLGRVRSLDRDVTNGIKTMHLKGRILRYGKTINGYYQVILSCNGEHKHPLVHRLVAEAFIPNPDNLPEVNHKDEVTTNNVVTNLEWCDRKYNVNYGTGIDRRSCKFFKRIEQLTIDGRHVAYYDSIAELVRLSGGKYKANNIYMAARGDNKSSYGYRWRYIDK